MAIVSNKELGRRYRVFNLRMTTLIKISFISLAAFVLIAGGYWLATNFQELYEGTGIGMASGQGDVRTLLWKNGFSAFVDRPLIGHGPGHFSGFDGPYMGFEAHSLLFDWLASYGLIGFLFLAGYLLFVFVRLLRNGSYSVISIMGIVLLLSVFHFFARQPVFWFALFFCGFAAFVSKHHAK